jgi:hypothetical protein
MAVSLSFIVATRQAFHRMNAHSTAANNPTEHHKHHNQGQFW